MLRLTQNQLSAFEGGALDQFVQRGVLHLRQNLADETAQFHDRDLQIRIRTCIERAKPYGFHTEQQVMTFVVATYLAGEHFDKDPKYQQAHALLTDRGQSPQAKSALLLIVLSTQEEEA